MISDGAGLEAVSGDRLRLPQHENLFGVPEGADEVVRILRETVPGALTTAAAVREWRGA